MILIGRFAEGIGRFYATADGQPAKLRHIILQTSIRVEGDRAFYYLVFAALLIAYCLGRAIVASRFGRVLRGSPGVTRTLEVVSTGRSGVIAFASTVISLICGVLAGYALSRLNFAFAGSLGTGIFVTYLVPQTLLFIPLADIIRDMQLGNTPWALMLTYPTILIPFCTWLLMGYFRSIPYELEECALIDGATRWQILVKIILPLAVPGLISAGIFAFTLSWNEFIYALTFVSSSEVKTVPVGVITELVEGDVYHWGPLMAGALLGSLPVAIIYSFFVEYYVSGLTGAVKE